MGTAVFSLTSNRNSLKNQREGHLIVDVRPKVQRRVKALGFRGNRKYKHASQTTKPNRGNQNEVKCV
jgi:hypothetical protein